MNGYGDCAEWTDDGCVWRRSRAPCLGSFKHTYISWQPCLHVIIYYQANLSVSEVAGERSLC
jgi:hypothetical protein